MVLELIWLGLLIVFVVAERISVGLTSIWFAAGALLALISALLHAPLWVQLTLFIGVSLVCLAAVRPLARRYLNSRVVPTNADRVIGSEARVTEDIDNIRGKGAVIVGGVTWTARSEGDEPIPAGETVLAMRSTSPSPRAVLCALSASRA